MTINDFLAQFISASLEKEGYKLSPIEVELLYLFGTQNKPLEADEISRMNENINPETINQLLEDMEKKKLIIQGSSYELDEEGKKVFKICTKIQIDIEPVIKTNPYYNNLYKTSSTAIKM